jgi:hypothetical protein
MGSPVEIILTVIVLSFWFLFPIGMFLSVSHVDKNTDQIIRLGHRRHDSMEPSEPEPYDRKPLYKNRNPKHWKPDYRYSFRPLVRH